MGAGKTGGDFVVGALEANLVPTLNHTRAEVLVVGLTLLDCNDKSTSGSVDSLGRVPLVIAGTPVPEIDGFPVRVISWPEGTTLLLELIGEDKVPGGAIDGRSAAHSGLWSVGIDQTTLC